MILTHWLKNLCGNLGEYRVQRKARRRRPARNGLASRVEDLERRQLLSAATYEWTYSPVEANQNTNPAIVDTVSSTTQGNPQTGTDLTADEIQPMYRCYNPNGNFTIYTTNKHEFDTLKSWGYRDETEGVPGFDVLNTPSHGARPIHRLYNPNNSQHYFTMNDGERDFLVRAGWNAEPDMGHALSKNLARPGMAEVYMLYNHQGGDHVFTADIAEVQKLLSGPGRWEQQTSLGYALPVRSKNTPSPSVTVNKDSSLTIVPNGYSVKSNDLIRVVFTEANGNRHSIDAINVGDNVIHVALPILMNSAGDNSRAGTVSVSVRTPDGVEHPTLAQLVVPDLPQTNEPAGTLFLALLDTLDTLAKHNIGQLQSIAASTNGRFDATNFTRTLGDELANNEAMRQHVLPLVNGKVDRVVFASDGGRTMYFDRRSLALMDRFIASLVVGMDAVGADTALVSALRLAQATGDVKSFSQKVREIGTTIIQGVHNAAEQVAKAAPRANAAAEKIGPIVQLVGLATADPALAAAGSYLPATVKLITNMAGVLAANTAQSKDPKSGTLIEQIGSAVKQPAIDLAVKEFTGVLVKKIPGALRADYPKLPADKVMVDDIKAGVATLKGLMAATNTDNPRSMIKQLAKHAMGSEPDPQPRPEPDPTNPGPAPEPAPQPWNPDPNPDPDPNPWNPEPTPEPDPDPWNPDPNPDPDPKPWNPEPIPEPDPEPWNPDPNPEPWPNPDPEPQPVPCDDAWCSPNPGPSPSPTPAGGTWQFTIGWDDAYAGAQRMTYSNSSYDEAQQTLKGLLASGYYYVVEQVHQVND